MPLIIVIVGGRNSLKSEIRSFKQTHKIENMINCVRLTIESIISKEFKVIVTVNC